MVRPAPPLWPPRFVFSGKGGIEVMNSRLRILQGIAHFISSREE